MKYDCAGNLREKWVQTAPFLASLDAPTSRSYNVTTFTYDILNRKTSESITVDGRARTTNYRYDSYGRLSYVVHPVGNVEEYEYDPLGRVTKVRQHASRTGNPDSRPSNTSSDVVTKTAYDGRGHPRTTWI